MAGNLPSIDARQLEITPKEISRSGRVYRFKLESDLPRTGNLLLVQIGDRPVMAFRVLKTDSGSKEIIAKRIRRYDQEGRLQLEKKYLAAEKVADLVSPPESESSPAEAPRIAREDPTTAPEAPTTAPEAPMAAREAPTTAPEATTAASEPEKTNQVETPIEQEPADPNAPALLGISGPEDPNTETPVVSGSLDRFDEELDASTSPRDVSSGEQSSGEETGATRGGPGIEEHESAIQFEHMAGLSVGRFMNMSGFSIPGTGHNGFTAYYNEIIDRDLWFKGHAPQDSLSLEFGLGYYSRVNLTGTFDNYDVIPIRSELLYTLQFTPKFALLAHVGAQFNWVISSDKANEIGLSILEGIQPNIGMGLLYNIGPQWYLRGDLGLDRIAIGLAVKW
ncbi:MAG: hypothetical protein KGP28_01325 [Bdellovibrionales bacterium]|nr:hypothetical protein [Bdellovibrionales bacterium]